MTQDPFVVTTRTSWLQRLVSALAGLLVGIVLVIAALTVLVSNESRAVRATVALEQGGRLVTSASADRIDPAMNGRPVHIIGTGQTAAPLVDTDTGLRVSGLRLMRKVELYQWVETVRTETRTRLGGGEETVATYDYGQQWSSYPIDSSRFKQPLGHVNPPALLTDRDFLPTEISLGARRLDSEGAESLPTTEAVVPLAGDAQEAERRLGRKTVVSGETLYVGADPDLPTVGDIRIRYAIAPIGSISVIAAQNGHRLTVYATRQARLFEVRAGRIDAETILQEVKVANQWTTWLVRLSGLFAAVLGFALILNPAKVAADVFPPAGAVVGFGVGAAAMFAGTVLSLGTIAVSWLLVRPIPSLVAFAMMTIAAVTLWRFKARRCAETSASQRPL